MLSESYRGTSKFINSFSAVSVCINDSFFGYFVGLERDPRFKSCERINTIDFSLFLKIKSLDMFV